MRITTHGAYLIQLTRYPRFFPVNCYMVREGDSLTVIDTGLPGSAPVIMAAARELRLPIQRIILTHAHFDHLGALDALRQLLPDATVFASKRDTRFMHGDMSLDADEPQAPLRGSYLKVKTLPNQLVQDGDRIGSLQVVATPGHTPGHIALIDTRDQTLIAGDAFQTRAGIAVSGTLRPWFPFPAIATWHRPSALESARRLQALQPARLAVGHGEVLENPRGEMEHAINVAAQAVERSQTHGA